MPGISNKTIEQFQNRVNRFDQTYVNDWDKWLNTGSQERPRQLGVILRKWQACRPSEQVRFIAVTNGVLRPGTEAERIWVRYRRLGNAFCEIPATI